MRSAVRETEARSSETGYSGLMVRMRAMAYHPAFGEKACETRRALAARGVVRLGTEIPSPVTFRTAIRSPRSIVVDGRLGDPWRPSVLVAPRASV
ncbi:hypothetical protein GCM10009759_51780 [Kitasatospora saccharophila]|uniref:Uncharacterized protein n=1 Tax=Kitasatospora saccharophila TaxID=407973 RepID=A0ABN2XGX7_9ACTN